MLNMLIYFGMVAVGVAIIVLTHFNFIEPFAAEIMIISLIAFCGWYLTKQFGKGKDA